MDNDKAIQPFVLKYNEEHEYFFREGCHILEMLNQPEDPELSIARARVKPGVTTRVHYLKGTTERYVILEGSGTVTLGELQKTVALGDTLVIPANCPQSIENTGACDLVFLAICTPRFKPENYGEET